ncbi:MAG: helix-turn-helix transcriptional regulator [Alphaproteobacteria bacterium]|nr:helix-turn-helix transcriptional regulator [Alphaproteobacteria bacterium]
MDKRERAVQFRQRMLAAMESAGMNRSALASATGAQRSTIGKILAEGSVQLPSVHLAANCASALGVSLDWLAALTERMERPGDVVEDGIRVEAAARTSSDDRLLEWHQEAAGYKVRHVPTSLPELLKTRDVLEWEYRAHLGKTPGQAIAAMEARMDWMRQNMSDYEVALPRHEIESFARGEGYWCGLGAAARSSQLERMAQVCEQLYPTLRIFIYDAHQIFSAPMTVFGPLLGVIYVGSVTLAFRQAERVRSLARHFDGLVRVAEGDPRDVPKWFEELACNVPRRTSWTSIADVN